MTRMPPHHAESEADCLASMLQIKSAAGRVFEIVSAADFYVPKHREMATAIETLHRAGRTIDPTTVSSELARTGSRIDSKELQDFMLAASPWKNPEEYAVTVAERARCRQMIGLAHDISEAAWESDLDSALELQRTPVGSANGVAEEPIRLGELLASVDPPYDWCIEGLMEFGNRLIFTGNEGAGKTTLMRQIAVCAAVGHHPFAGHRTRRRRVLYLDLQDNANQNRREFRPLIERYQKLEEWDDHYFALHLEPAGLDLTTVSSQTWLRAQVEQMGAEALFIGPLYKAYAGTPKRSKDSEETAMLVQDYLDRLIAGCHCCVILEGHAPYGERGDRAGFRVRGSSAWLGWPDFVLGLNRQSTSSGSPPSVKIERPRQDRDRSRGSRWPDFLVEGRNGELPWVAPGDWKAPLEEDSPF